MQKVAITMNEKKKRKGGAPVTYQASGKQHGISFDNNTHQKQRWSFATIVVVGCHPKMLKNTWQNSKK